MKRLITAVTAVAAGCLGAFADTYDEKLDYIDTTGTQWVDTGIVPAYGSTRMVAELAMLETSSVDAGLFGVMRVANQTWKMEGYWITSFSCRAKSGTFYPDWTGGEQLGSYSINYAVETRTKIESVKATAYFNGAKRGGYYDVPGGSNGYHVPDAPSDAANRPYANNQTIYIGNVNNADGSLYSAGVRTRWYSFSVYSGDALVAHYIPAMKDGVAGFFETESEKFCPSQGADAFVAPVRRYWKGGGETAALDDPTNWEGGIVPSAGENVVIPAEKTMTTDATGVAFLNSLKQVKILDGATLVLDRCTAVTMTVPLAGTGHFVIKDAPDTTSQYLVNLKSDNSAYTGDFLVTNAGCIVTHKLALGGENGGHVTVFTCNGTRRLTFEASGNYYNEFDLHMSSSILIAHLPDTHLKGDVHIWGGINIHGCASPGYLYLDGKVDRKSDGIIYLSAMPHLGGGVDFSGFSSNVYADGGASFYLGGEDGSVKSLGNCYVGGKILFEAPNVFNPKYGYSLTLGLNSNASVFDLRGFDQRIADFNTQYQKYVTVTSSQGPATLTILGYIRRDALPAYTWVGTGLTNFTGNLSINFYSTNRTDNVNNCAYFTNVCGTMTGGFSVGKGKMALRANTHFPNVSFLKAYESGVLTIESNDIGTETNLAVSVSGKAKLSIAADITIAAHTAMVGDDHWLQPGTYGGPDSAAPCKLSQLSGTGLLTVETYGGPPGFLLLVR